MKDKIKEIILQIKEDLNTQDYENFIKYDFKNEFKKQINKINNLNDNEPLTEFKKMLIYKVYANGLGIDCDACLRAIIIFALAYPYVLEKNRRICRQGKTHKYTLAFKEISPEIADFEFRGDTMNSFLRINKKYVGYNLAKKVNKENNYLVNKFIKYNHTVGNFMPVPFKSMVGRKCLSFNLARNNKVSDYWDLTLNNIYKWYVTNDDIYIKNLIGSSNDVLIMVKHWLTIFGTGKSGWCNFVDLNYFKGNFVSEDYIPRELSPHHFNNKHFNISNKYYEEYFKNVTKAIKLRSKMIADVLVEKIGNLSDEEIDELVSSLIFE